MVWQRESFPSVLPYLQITGRLIADGGLEVGENDAILFGLRAGSTRTTYGLQVQPRFGNGWFTPGAGAERLTVARYPDGSVHLCGLVSNVTPANRGDGVYAFDFTLTTHAQTFIPKVEVHMLADGADRANNQQPVFVVGTDGTVRCYNLNNTVAAQYDYRLNAYWNIYTTPGLYEGTGGF